MNPQGSKIGSRGLNEAQRNDTPGHLRFCGRIPAGMPEPCLILWDPLTSLLITISFASRRDKVRRYIESQEEHHRKVTFVDELRILLEKHGVEYDPKYLE